MTAMSSDEILAVFDGEAAMTESGKVSTFIQNCSNARSVNDIRSLQFTTGLSTLSDSFWDVRDCVTSNNPHECTNDTIVIVFTDSVNDTRALSDFDALTDIAGPTKHVGAFRNAKQLGLDVHKDDSDSDSLAPSFCVVFKEGAYLLYPYVLPPSKAFILDLFIKPSRSLKFSVHQLYH